MLISSSGLELVNQEIEDTKAEIDEYISRLTEQRDTLIHNQKRNAVVIKNFSKLLNGRWLLRHKQQFNMNEDLKT